MNKEYVKEVVSEIERIKYDDESAHTKEDDLYRWILESIADGSCEDPKSCAIEALKTQEIDFARWRA